MCSPDLTGMTPKTYAPSQARQPIGSDAHANSGSSNLQAALYTRDLVEAPPQLLRDAVQVLIKMQVCDVVPSLENPCDLSALL